MKEKKFDLFGTKYTIKYVDTVKNDNGGDIYGEMDGSYKEIRIAKTINKHVLTEDELKLTLYHELFHAIFGEGCYMNSNSDEPLVEWCAKCIQSLVKQKII